MNAADRLFVALDVPTLPEATVLLDRLKGVVTGVKIGSQLFTVAGPAAVEAARKRDFRVFLDLKFHDIPNTVAGAARAAAQLGVYMFNIHASGGAAMMRAAAEALQEETARTKARRPICLGVTVLTSLDRRTLSTEVGVSASIPGHVLHLATLARDAGLDGCVASPQEIGALRTALGGEWVIVTPGIRPAAGDDDQVRTATARAAVSRGADYIVVGRPITGAPDPAESAAAIVRELAVI